MKAETGRHIHCQSCGRHLGCQADAADHPPEAMRHGPVTLEDLLRLDGKLGESDESGGGIIPLYKEVRQIA